MLANTKLENKLFILLLIFLSEGILREIFFSFSNLLIFSKSIFILYILFTTPISKKFLSFYLGMIMVFALLTLVQFINLKFFFENISLVITTGFHNNFFFILLTYFITKVNYKSFVLKINKIVLLYLILDLIFVYFQLIFKSNSILTDADTFRSIGVGQTIRPNGLSTSPYGHMVTIILLYSISLSSLAFRSLKKSDYIILVLVLVLVITSFQRSFLFYIFPILILLAFRFKSSVNFNTNFFLFFLLIGATMFFYIPEDFIERIFTASANENRILSFLPFNFINRVFYEFLQPFIIKSPDFFGIIIGSGSNSTFLLEPNFKAQVYNTFASPYGGPFESGLSRHLLDFGYLGYFIIFFRYFFFIYLLHKFLFSKNNVNKPIIASLLPFILISHLSSHNSVIFVCFFLLGLYFNSNYEKNSITRLHT